jgi:signal transduction histidine kinase
MGTDAIPLRRDHVNVAVLLELPTEVMQRQARDLGITLAIVIDDWAITSLVGSALRHVASPGGRIDVRVSYDAAGGCVSITVRDDGPGISPEQVTRMLNRTNWHPGAALALLLVEDIAKAHGGGIHVRSSAERSGHFTEIRFTVSAAPAVRP